MIKYFKTHSKLRNSILLTLVIVAIPLSYLLGGYHLVDNWLSNQVRRDTNAMIQNHYINSVKRNVTPKDVAEVEHKINFIYDNNLKNNLRSDTNAILSQAELQSNLLAQVQTDYHAKDLSKIKISSVKKILTKAQDVLNPQVRTEILRKGNIVLDRSTRTQKAITAVDKLYKQKSYSRDDLSKYYTALALTDLVYGEQTKKDLQAKLRAVYDQLNQKLSQTEKEKQKAVKRAIAGLKNNRFTGGDSTITTNKLTPAEMLAFKELDNQTGLFLNLTANQIVGYELSTSKTDVDKLLHDDVIIAPKAIKALKGNDGTNPTKIDDQTIRFQVNGKQVNLTANDDTAENGVANEYNITVGQDTINTILDKIKSTKAILHLTE